jgi:hypothetical protein
LGRARPLKVIESNFFLIQLAGLHPSLKQWDMIKETFDLDVALNPEAFEEIPETPLRAVGLNTIPPRTVYFQVDETEEAVILIGIV